MYSTTGKMVLSTELHLGENVIGINLPDGIYAVRIHLDSGKVVNTKLIVSK